MKSGVHVVLVTGGATGIGFAIAQKFLAHGNRVIAVGRNEESLNKAAGQLAGLTTCVADVSVAADRHRLTALFPDVTVLVNNAGIQSSKPMAESTPQDIEHEIAVNLSAPILLSLSFLPLLKLHSEAAIVNVTSGLALVPKQATAIYCATKAGLHSATKTLRWQLEGTPVRVFEVLPPFVETAMTAHRGGKGMKPDELADAFWRGFVANRHEMLVGPTRLLALIKRLSPALADKLVRHRA